MTETDLMTFLTSAMLDYDDENGPVTRVRTFAEAGLMTNNTGLVLRTEDGSEFQLTIVKSR